MGALTVFSPLLSIDFCQLSGMHLLVGRYLEAGAAGLRWRAAQLIGTCSQNVAAIQEQVLGLGALRKLLRLLDRDSCDTVRVKALFAISCECSRISGGGPGASVDHRGWVCWIHRGEKVGVLSLLFELYSCWDSVWCRRQSSEVRARY